MEFFCLYYGLFIPLHRFLDKQQIQTIGVKEASQYEA